MALIDCPECGKKVSDMAKACPSCGYPVFDLFTKKKLSEKEIQDIEEDKIDYHELLEKTIKEVDERNI